MTANEGSPQIATLQIVLAKLRIGQMNDPISLIINTSKQGNEKHRPTY